MTKVLHSFYNIDTFDSIGPVEVTRRDKWEFLGALGLVLVIAAITCPW